MQNELPWIAEARKHIGTREIVGKQHNPKIVNWLIKLGAWWRNDEVAWCGTLTAHCLKTAGVPIPKHWYRALDYLNYGTKLDKPAYGCVAVKSRQGGGHVGFVVGQYANGDLAILGGNQGNACNISRYPRNVFQFRWYGTQAKPAENRYQLPVLNSGNKAGSEA